MNIHRKRLLLTFIPIIIIAVLLSGCEEDDGKGYVFGYDISANPDTLDPQCAATTQAYLLIGNIFEGLLKTDSEGNISEAGAAAYSVSDDGLTYIFSLDREKYWVDVNGFEKPVTADDYVYGFTRLFLPETRAANAPEFFCIKNSEKINSGEITDVSQLGVKADGEYKLTIQLDYPNSNLPMLLTTAPAMPCNEEYFLAAQGKYGLTAKTTPSNGAFFVKTWNYDKWSSDNNNLVLRYNEKYNKKNEVYPLGLNFFIEDNENFISDFLDGTSQNILLTGSDAQTFIRKGYSYEEYGTAVYGIIMNTRSSIFSDSLMRYALLYASDTDKLSLPFGYTALSAAVPDSVGITGLNYREYCDISKFVKTDKVKAQTAYKKACESVNKEDLYNVKLIAMQNRDEEIVEAAKEILQHWQAVLGFYCTVEFLPQSEYESAIENGDYSLAITRYSGKYNSPDSYLSMFTTEGYKYSAMDSEYTSLLKSASEAITTEERYLYSSQAEKLLMTDGRFIPLACLTEYFFGAEGCADVKYNAFTGVIDYTKALYFE